MVVLLVSLQIEEDCAKLAAKAEAAKRQQEQLARENDARLQARKVILSPLCGIETGLRLLKEPTVIDCII